jgi:thiosulfate dehydrogenase [quinone] large subunit
MRPDLSVSFPGSLSPLQQVALVLLRTLVGWHFLYEGVYKVLLPGWTRDGRPLPAWTAAAFLEGADGPLAPLARALAEAGGGLVLDRAVIAALVAIGLSLTLGLFARAGAAGAFLFLLLVYLLRLPGKGLPQPGAEGTYLLVDKTLVEAGAALLLLAFPTGRIAGLDRLRRRREPLAARRTQEIAP